MGKYIDGSGLSHFMGIIKGAFASKADAVKSITRSGTTFTATKADGTTFTFTQQDNTVAKTSTTPKMDGAAAIGSETKYAAGDHVHPTDTSRVPTSRKINGKALSADVVLTGQDIKFLSTDADSITDQFESLLENIDGAVAFGTVKVGSTMVVANSMFGALELVAGSNVTLTPDATNDKVTIAATDTTALGSMTGTLGVAHGDTGVATLGAGVVYHSANGTGALSIATAANLVSAIGNSAVNRATADASGNNIANTYATKTELGTATAGALQYKGTVAAESTITGAAYKKGWYYVVSTAGTYLGKVCEVGDMLIAKQDKTSTPANDWDAVQSNIEVLSNDEIDALWAAA